MAETATAPYASAAMRRCALAGTAGSASAGGSSGWTVSATLPFVDRDHLHIHNHHGEHIDERRTFGELAEARLTGRYPSPLEGSDAAPRMAGVFFGLKLPTGRTPVADDEAASVRRWVRAARCPAAVLGDPPRRGRRRRATPGPAACP